LLPECVEENTVRLKEGSDELLFTSPVTIEDTVKVVRDGVLELKLAI
jgi:hypothetical protein